MQEEGPPTYTWEQYFHIPCDACPRCRTWCTTTSTSYLRVNCVMSPRSQLRSADDGRADACAQLARCPGAWAERRRNQGSGLGGDDWTSFVCCLFVFLSGELNTLSSVSRGFGGGSQPTRVPVPLTLSTLPSRA